MSDNDTEPMDVCEVDMSKLQQPTASPDEPAESMMTAAQKEDEIHVELSVKWSESSQPLKYQFELEKLLQSWFNDNFSGDCRVIKASEHDALMRVPASALKKFEELSGQTLTSKDKKRTVKLLSINGKQPQTQIPHKAPMNFPSASHLLNEKVHLGGDGEFSSSAAGSAADSKARDKSCTCSVSVAHFWYVNHIYKEEINRIENENRVKFAADVTVKFEPNPENGDPAKALAEFTSLVQKSLSESNGVVIPFKGMSLEGLSKMLNVIQQSQNKLLLTLSSEEMMLCGPSQSQDALQSLNATWNTSTNTKTTWASATIGMSIKDPLIEGLTFDQSYWNLMRTNFKDQIAKIKEKFDVSFIESVINPGKVNVKAFYKSPAGNISLESHAIRALVRLYHTIITSPSSSGFTKNFIRGSNSSVKNNNYQSEGASSGPVSKGKPGYNMDNSEQATGEATVGDKEDTNCPVCMDPFINKKQLKCKHEFCEECLERSKGSIGPMCPVCKDVYGVIEGNQPDGTMSSAKVSTSLPGFPGCGTIVITYNIPSGKQTKKHPKPGCYYDGINRIAYLPDNKEGKEVLHLLKKAFDQRLIFTVGMSRTTGRENQVTWNDIHHKTATTGGPESFGYPDPGYLSRVREELKAKGIK